MDIYCADNNTNVVLQSFDIMCLWCAVGSFNSSAVSPGKHRVMRENTRMLKLPGNLTAPGNHCHISIPSSVGPHKPCTPSPPGSNPVSSLGCWHSSGSLFEPDSHRLGPHVLVEFGCDRRNSQEKKCQSWKELWIVIGNVQDTHCMYAHTVTVEPVQDSRL